MNKYYICILLTLGLLINAPKDEQTDNHTLNKNSNEQNINEQTTLNSQETKGTQQNQINQKNNNYPWKKKLLSQQ